MEWPESKDKRKTNRVNVKHVIGDLGEVEKDSVITVGFNSRRYQARVVDQLDWKPQTSAERSVLVLIIRRSMYKGISHSVYIVYV